jgi:hypothetical protein
VLNGTNDHCIEPTLLLVGEREELVHRLRVCVGPPALRRRAVDPARAFGERRLLAMVAVDLRRRSDQDPLREAVALVEHHLGPWTFVTSVRTGSSTIRRTPTAAAR